MSQCWARPSHSLVVSWAVVVVPEVPAAAAGVASPGAERRQRDDQQQHTEDYPQPERANAQETVEQVVKQMVQENSLLLLASILRPTSLQAFL